MDTFRTPDTNWQLQMTTMIGVNDVRILIEMVITTNFIGGGEKHQGYDGFR